MMRVKRLNNKTYNLLKMIADDGLDHILLSICCIINGDLCDFFKQIYYKSIT